MTALLLSGSTSASTSVDAEPPRHGPAVVRLSPVSMTMRMPSPRSASSAAASSPSPDRRWRSRPAGLPSTATKMAVAPSRRWLLGGRVAARRSNAELGPAKPALPSATLRPSTLPATPLPVGESKSARVRQRRCCARARPPRSRAPTDVRSRAPALAARRSTSASPTRAGDDRDDLRLAFGQGAGLVDDQRVDLLHALQRLGILDQDAGRAPRPTPTMIDIGVASPSAQGQAMIRTETAATSA